MEDSLLVREINWMETGQARKLRGEYIYPHSLLVREINWMETTKSKLIVVMSVVLNSLLVREINWMETSLGVPSKPISLHTLPTR